MKFKVILEKESDGRYSVHCPALKGCYSYGNTKEEALKNIQEAIQGCMEALNRRAENLKTKGNNIYEVAV